MSRIRQLALLLWLFAAGALPALAAPVTVSLVLGDLDSQTALLAVRQLQADRALRQVRFAIYPTVGLADADLAALRASRIVLVQTLGRTLATQLGDEFRQLAQRGGRVYAVGRTWDADFADRGLRQDDTLREYMIAGGPDNVANMVRLALARDAGIGKLPPPPVTIPDMGYYVPGSARITDDFAEFRRAYRGRAGAPWVAVLFYRGSVVSGQTATVDAIVRELEQRGLNALPVFGFPSEQVVDKLLVGADLRPRLAAVIALAMKIGNTPEKLVPALTRLDVPVLNAITLHSQSRAQWEASPTGLDITERSWQIASAELGGAVAPTVVASKESRRDVGSGIEIIVETPIPERVARIAERARRWAELGATPNPGKRVALIYYNYPPGKSNIGASYLNVLPRSLWQILGRLRSEQYWLQGAPESPEALQATISQRGANLGVWEPEVIEAMVRSGQVVLWPVSEYRKYYARLPAELRTAMEQTWGHPEHARISVWHDRNDDTHFVFPAQRWGNLIVAAQPSRGLEQDIKKLYHNVTVPPHHQYLAFYLWLQHEVGAHAMIHLGTHATHEWHNGKEVGYTAADPGEAFVGAVPQLYPFIVDDIGESLQAKRRGMATIISHLTPPLDKAGLNPELRELIGFISDLAVARDKGTLAPAAIREEIARRAERMGLLKDLGLTQIDDEAIEVIEHYIKEVGEKITPFGMHTFGIAPAARYRRSTAEAVLSLESGLTPADYEARRAWLEAALERSGQAELDALIAGLAGRYVAAGPGNDPIRTPDSLPTGRNLYGFDPSRLPTTATYAAGAKLAADLVADWRRRHGRYPERLVFNLWGVESSRHEGMMEAQIMALWGVRPVWDGRGRVTGVTLIPRAELGRPRVDVTVVPSGLYRDLFSPLLKLLDEAAVTAQQATEADNPLRRNLARTREALLAQGVAPELAERLAAVRLFSVPSGAYGTNLNKAVPLANTWDNESELADLYFMRMSHPYGRGFWGGRTLQDGKVNADSPSELSRPLAVNLLKLALEGVEAAIHSRSSNIYATLDNDDFYQYLGGTALAVRQVNGKTPEVLVTNMANPREARTETLEKYMGRELRARYLNPQWIKAMLGEGYAGARFMHQVVENLWGWTVTTPESVGNEKWQEMYETYVVDRHQLGIKDKFRAAGNLLAYQAMVDHMLVAINKGYWQASEETTAKLNATNFEVIAEAGVACPPEACSSPQVSALRRAAEKAALAATVAAPPTGLMPVKANPAPAASGKPPTPSVDSAAAPLQPAPAASVEGYEMAELPQQQIAGSVSVPATMGGIGLVLGLLVALGALLRKLRSRRGAWLAGAPGRGG